jgi:hypothetical protein
LIDFTFLSFFLLLKPTCHVPSLSTETFQEKTGLRDFFIPKNKIDGRNHMPQQRNSLQPISIETAIKSLNLVRRQKINDGIVLMTLQRLLL